MNGPIYSFFTYLVSPILATQATIIEPNKAAFLKIKITILYIIFFRVINVFKKFYKYFIF